MVTNGGRCLLFFQLRVSNPQLISSSILIVLCSLLIVSFLQYESCHVEIRPFSIRRILYYHSFFFLLLLAIFIIQSPSPMTTYISMLYITYYIITLCKIKEGGTRTSSYHFAATARVLVHPFASSSFIRVFHTAIPKLSDSYW